MADDTTPDSTPDAPAVEEAAVEEPDTFPRAYVEQLRRENADFRTKGKRADELARRLTTAMAGALGVLHDPSDLPVDDRLMGGDGLPDAEKIDAAVTELVRAKPHLARIRPTGNVGQGTSSAPVSAGLLDIFNGRD